MLVIQQGPLARLSGYWAPLSGKLEHGETQAEALIREVHEEVGLSLARGQGLGVADRGSRADRPHTETSPDNAATPLAHEMAEADPATGRTARS
ncbi:NUDIX hydrolase [Streptomyces sp. Tue6028]|uniref:NUDIX hydrolase n=1 Tax=Streptomyces sp. Tue6028 TaxID=2036037 RepID=UPI003EB72E63